MNTLDNLLSLNGEIFPMDNGCWVKFEAKVIAPNENIPHGVRYSLTLHDKRNNRVVGYDNAHSYKTKNAKFGAKKTTFDHIHKKEIVLSYEFDSADKLIEDFWTSVNQYLDNI
jgi:hypothetical protein